MKYLSVCSGIEASTVAWKPLGWEAVAFSEIDPFPAAVLSCRYPDVPNLGDFTQIGPADHEPIDLIVGGTPCQDFSVAGLRAGMAGSRGNLSLEFLRLLDRERPRWALWENVPGVLSSNCGRDFGSFLGGLVECGYGWAYRVLDAQFVRVDGFERAVPQRRRRVFVVGYLGDWRRAAAVLFERESLRGGPAPRRKTGEEIAKAVAPCIGTSGRGFERVGDPRGQDALVAFGGGNASGPIAVATALNGRGGVGRMDFNTETFVVFDCKTSGRNGFGAGDVSPTLRRMSHAGSHPNAGGQIAVAFDLRGRRGGARFEGPHATANVRASSGGSSRSYVVNSLVVRRLTPCECERLMGFPDDYTAIRYRGKPAADGPRYGVLGNSMAVNCMRWLGQRIAAVCRLIDPLESERGAR